MFTIDADYNITAHDSPRPAREDTTSFSTQREFGAATANWSITQFVELWNSFAGVAPFGHLRPVAKFTDRNTAIKRIWAALQELAAAASPTLSGNSPSNEGEKQEVEPPPTTALPPSRKESAPEEFTAPSTEATITTEDVETMATPKKKAAKAPRKAGVRAQRAAKVPREGSRKETVLALVGRKHGATLAEIMESTGWQPHSVRGFIATLGTKHGCKISSTKNEAGERVYQGA